MAVPGGASMALFVDLNFPIKFIRSQLKPPYSDGGIRLCTIVHSFSMANPMGSPSDPHNGSSQTKYKPT